MLVPSPPYTATTSTPDSTACRASSRASPGPVVVATSRLHPPCSRDRASRRGVLSLVRAATGLVMRRARATSVVPVPAELGPELVPPGGRERICGQPLRKTGLERLGRQYHAQLPYEPVLQARAEVPGTEGLTGAEAEPGIGSDEELVGDRPTDGKLGRRGASPDEPRGREPGPDLQQSLGGAQQGPLQLGGQGVGGVGHEGRGDLAPVVELELSRRPGVQGSEYQQGDQLGLRNRGTIRRS